MKLLYESSDRYEIEGCKLLLESRGIPVHISNEDSNRNLSYMALAVKLGIWVVFEDQYNDAVALLNDDTHEVENPRSIEAYHSALNEAQGKMAESNFDKAMLLLVLLLILGIVAYLVS